MSAATYTRDHTVDGDRTFTVQYHTDSVEGYHDADDRWVRGHEAGITIIWTCGDSVGPWTIGEFEELLKNAAKGTAQFPYRGIVNNDNYLLYFDKERGVIRYSDMIGTGYDEDGPNLNELRKALRGIKAALKRGVLTNAPAESASRLGGEPGNVHPD
jgi:hypothetical protein